MAGSLKSVGTALGADPTDRTDASAEVRIAGLAQPTLEAFTHRGAEGTIDMGFAELPATVVAGIVNLELLMHAWDFAKAIGQELHVSDMVSDHVTRLAEETSPIRSGPAAASLQPSQWQRRPEAWNGSWRSPAGAFRPDQRTGAPVE
ncbi:hypothetical protein [Arthrobacter sp. VKM Ac-2550]|uniref:hypothetical protein n=1 Tax=Crystallibacter permensis TaxID=1938888 RepID=UPI002226D39B|nr:hypothetical protein [Arthrobacter sp. VKM Ac-2550]MCW2134547.1 hypothetical protein [Arthrobacter sp. VKM Ac-2550]